MPTRQHKISNSRSGSWTRSLRQLAGERSFWIIVVILGILTLLHYLRPQITLASVGFVDRHAIERIVFLLPVAAATFAFGQRGGAVTLGISILIMLPRVFLISHYPGDTLLEILAVLVVGYLVVWMIATQEREKHLRQEAVSRLRMINAISSHVNRSWELEDILNGALDKVMEVTQVNMGDIFLVQGVSQDLVLMARKGAPAALTDQDNRTTLSSGLSARAVQTGKTRVVNDLLQESELLTSLAGETGMRSLVVMPLLSRNRVMGIMELADSRSGRFTSEDMELLTSVGNAVGAAVENAYLCRSSRYYAREITQAQEAERARIARDLHDETIQSLVVLSRQIEALAQASENAAPNTVQRLHELRKATDDIIGGIRRFSRALRPSTLDDLGLIPTLEGLAVSMTEQDGIPTKLWVSGEHRRLLPGLELVLFRIAQEALTNVKKHAGATRSTINLTFNDGTVEMVVQDNGKGFTLAAPVEELAVAGHLGLIGMRERTRLLGGTLKVQSELGRGTRIIATVPVAPADR